MPSLLSMQFRESVSKHKDYRMKLESDATISYPTGFLNFDFMNGNVVHVQNGEKNTKYYSVGIQDGCLVMLIGRSGCGKTTTLRMIAGFEMPTNGKILLTIHSKSPNC